MSPSPSSKSSIRTFTCAVGLAAGCLLLWAAPAFAAPANPSPAPLAQPITAPVVDIHVGSQTLDGGSTTEESTPGTKTRLDSAVLFDKDNAHLRAAAEAEIRELARNIRRQGPARITVTGYTDDLGSARHGLELSRARADAVAHVLQGDLPRSQYRITALGRGEQDPAVPNTSERNRSKNRRVIVTTHRDAGQQDHDDQTRVRPPSNRPKAPALPRAPR